MNFINEKRQMLTLNAEPGTTLFTEDTVTRHNKEYRVWNPGQSKLAAGIVKGAEIPKLPEDATILYLGAAHGYTVSYISDIFPKAKIVGVEFAPLVTQQLILNMQNRKNVFPIMEDALHPKRYESTVRIADFIFQDIAQKNQTEIFLKNTDHLLKRGGIAMLAVKAKSIDVTAKSKAVFSQVRRELSDQITIVDTKQLGPFQRDHALFICRKE